MLTFLIKEFSLEICEYMNGWMGECVSEWVGG